MNSTFSTLAIILNRRDWREADRLISVYTPEYGRLSLIARGACKANSKLAAHLEPISISRILIIKGKGVDYVGAALLEEVFLNIKQDLNKIYFAGEALRYFNALVPEGEGDINLFNWLKKWLLNLDSVAKNNFLDKNEGRFLLALFLWRLFKFLGYEPRFDICALCQNKIKPNNNYFAFNHGGLICSHCYLTNSKTLIPHSIMPISDNCIKLLRLTSNNNWHNLKFSPKILKEWENLNNFLFNWLRSC